jgi:transmembrane 9 superfamily protein 3
MIYVYAGTSGVAGFAAARYLTQQRPGAGDGDGAAVRTGVATALLVPVCVAAVGAILAAIAAPTGVIGVVSVPGVLRLLSLWLLVVVPSHVAGALVGRWHRAQCGDRASTFLTISIPPYERDRRRRLTVAPHNFIAARPRCVLALCILSVGLIAFGALFVKSHYIMTGLWKYMRYLVSWTSLTALILLLAVICALSAVLVPLSFAAYPPSPATPGAWQWHAFVGAASTGGYVFLYSVAFFVNKTHLEGSFGVAHYFGTMSLISAGIALACGAAGHWAACRYVTLLYSHSKVA